MGDTPNVWSLNEDVIIDIMLLDPVTSLGLTGKASKINISIRNSSDQYFGGGSFGGSYAQVNPSEVDATNEPGRYKYVIPAAVNLVEDEYYVYVSISDAPTVEAQTSELHILRDTDVRVYESEPQ